MSGVVTDRLRLVPIGPENAHDLWLVHSDEAVVAWYDGRAPTLEETEQQAAMWGAAWRDLGVHKWIAYRRESGEVVGRGGLSRTPVDDDWGQLYAFLPDESWTRGALPPFPVHTRWLEIGWALRRPFWGQGYASEIGRAGLDFAFGVLAMHAVVSCTAVDNERSRAVMARIGMPYAGEVVSDGERLAVHVLLRGERRRSFPSA